MEWKDKISTFKQIDVRGIQGNFFQGLKKQAMQLPAGSGLEIVQSFDPIPLYEVMEGLGFEHFTEQKGEAEFHPCLQIGRYFPGRSCHCMPIASSALRKKDP